MALSTNTAIAQAITKIGQRIRKQYQKYSEQLLQFVYIQFDVPKYLVEQPRTNVLTLVDRDCCPATVRMLELPMTALRLTLELEAHSFQHANQLARF